MIEAPSFSAPLGSVAVLLHPSTVPVVDVFRSLGSLEDQYDLVLLDGPEQALAVYTQPEAAKGIVSDALLLAFALTRQRGRPFSHKPLGSRQGSMDEYCLLAMVSLDFMSALAGELVRQIDLGSLIFEPPTLSEFRAIVGYKRPEEVIMDSALSKVEFNFRV
jgi:hypothetical protein